MTDEFTSITLKPIGFVKSAVKERPPLADFNWGEVVSEIVINNSLTDALDGLEGFSHIIVLYWMHRLTSGEVPLKTHPRGKKELPLTGIFATRTPNRPNRIGETTVRLLQRQGNILRVEGLDALDGTPVLDIKPYIPGREVGDNKVPKWLTSQ
ncbi:MAG: tRNA (N6-threonylcarbamoyladenosine(37)-N6)-methyltransferase TrmO [Chloroflexota bacterium]